MHYPDGNYRFTRSGTKCTVRNNIVYVQNGDVHDLSASPYAAVWLRPSLHSEDYSAWSDENRAAKRKAITEAAAAVREAEAARRQLADAALAKLTAKEREAVAAAYDMNADDCQ